MNKHSRKEIKDLKCLQQMLLRNSSLSKKEVDVWLKLNPLPVEWQEGKYAYALTEMPVGKFWTWYRKNIVGWKI